MRYAGFLLLGALVLALCGCRPDDSAVYTTYNGSTAETIYLHQNGTYTQTVTYYPERDGHRTHKKNDRAETYTNSGQWSLLPGQSRLPGTFPIGSAVDLQSALTTMPMVGADGEQPAGVYSNRVIPAGSFQNTIKSIEN